MAVGQESGQESRESRNPQLLFSHPARMCAKNLRSGILDGGIEHFPVGLPDASGLYPPLPVHIR